MTAEIPLSICLVHSHPAMTRAFKRLGYDVVEIVPDQGGFFDIGLTLEEMGVKPDILIQRESLNHRVLLTGLEKIHGKKVFWAVDPHLNAFWQAFYARGFDLVCSTQRKWIPELRARGARNVEWLPWFGFKMEWVPWGKREHDLTFVGRLEGARQMRKYLVEFLMKNAPGEKEATLAHNLKFGEMMSLYCNSRLAPNESIAGEVNFRLFETASCGCLSLCQDIGPDQDELFDPGREIRTYSNCLELKGLIKYYLGHPTEAKVLARAAHDRVRSEHMPAHRAQRLISLALEARTGVLESEKWLWLAMYYLWESGRANYSASELLQALSGLPDDPEVATALIRLLAGIGRKDKAMELMRQVLVADKFSESSDVNLAGSMSALHLVDDHDFWDMAKQFWYRRTRSRSRTKAEAPCNRVHLYELWGRELRRAGIEIRSGLPFDECRHIPASAWECFIKGLSEDPDNKGMLRLMEMFSREHTGLEQPRLGYLSRLTMLDPKDWRMGLETALLDLQCFRLEQGVEELFVYAKRARKQGQEKAFQRMLKAKDNSGLLVETLGF